MPKVSCIIPAYNEEPRIENVLRAVYGHSLVDEIIVVDDGSRDNTKNIVRRFGAIQLITHETNKGKSQAVATGLVRARGDVILLLDADLIDLTPRNITDLVEPILEKRADVSISLRKNAPWLSRKLGLDFISGERVFPKRLVEHDISNFQNLVGFGLEVYLNKLIIKNRYRIKVVLWENVISLWKYKKTGLFTGLKNDVRMIRDIIHTVSVFEVLHQVVTMVSLKVE